MCDIFRDSACGHLIRWASKNKFLAYPEDKDDFKAPAHYLHNAHNPLEDDLEAIIASEGAVRPVEGSNLPTPDSADSESTSYSPAAEDPEKASLGDSSSSRNSSEYHVGGTMRADTRIKIQHLQSRDHIERAITAQSQARAPAHKEKPIKPAKLSCGTIVVEWYSTHDPANPMNWSTWKKIFVASQINFYTMVVYMASAIYTPSEPAVIETFGVPLSVASLGLALYVFGYGLGPMIFAPISEIPSIGRNPPYVVTFAIFTILSVPTALVDNPTGLLLLRFLQGFFGSPCLATGGATMGDMFCMLHLPVVLPFWVASMTCGPALGPVIAGFSVPATNWHWSLWEILWMAGPVFIVLFFVLPETSHENILARRASRLRQLTGNPKYKSQGEIDRENLKTSAIVKEALYVPFKLIALDPSILFVTVYTSLMYAIFYSFFEAFPLVYIDLYGFNFGEMGLTFLSITVGVSIALPCYIVYLLLVVKPDVLKNGLGAPEKRLRPALLCTFFVPVGLFLFAWTSNGHVHWIVSVIGIAICSIGVFLVFQCIFVYLALSYPMYVASLYAGNDFARSSLSFAAILFSSPMFEHLGVDRGVTILAALTAGCVVGLYVLYFYGPKLRARSKFAVV